MAEANRDALQGHRARGQLHLAKYAEDSGKRLADSNGNLKNAKAFQQIAAGYRNVHPDDTPSTAIQVNVLSFAAIRADQVGE